MVFSQSRKVACSIICIFMFSTFAQADTAKKKDAKSADANIGAAQTQNVNAITKTLAGVGVNACLSTVQKTTSYLGYSGSPARILIPNEPKAQAQHDKRMIPIVMELALPNSPVFVSSVFSPSAINGCSSTYEAIVYWPVSCNEVYQKSYSQFKVEGLLARQINILALGSNAKLYLMPAGPGCISIKQEISN